MPDDVGSLLLRAGLVDSDQLNSARSVVDRDGGTVPEELVRLGHVCDEDLTAFYRSRLLIKRVNPSELTRLSSRLLAKLPSDMASEFRSIPVNLDREGNMTLIMSDPSDTKAAEEISFFTGTYIERAVATQAQIAWCLAHYYKHETPLYLDLVGNGSWPDLVNSDQPSVKRAQEAPNAVAASAQETAPIQVAPEQEPAQASSAVAPAEKAKPKKKKKARKKKKKAGKSATSAAQPKPQIEKSEEETGPLPLREFTRPKNQKPSPQELMTRSGEFKTLAKPERTLDEPPGVQICLDSDEEAIVQKIQRGTDTAPILLSSVKEAIQNEGSGPIVLSELKRKRRISRQTSVGLGIIGSKAASAAEQTDSDAPLPKKKELPKEMERPTQRALSDNPKPAGSTAAVNAQGARRSSTDIIEKLNRERSAINDASNKTDTQSIDDGWDTPSAVSSIAFLGTSPRTSTTSENEPLEQADIPTSKGDAITAQISQLKNKVAEGAKDVATSPSSDKDKAGENRAQTSVLASKAGQDLTSATNKPPAKEESAAILLLGAVRSIDRATDKREILEPALSFLDLAFERTGFLALKQDELKTWLLHGCNNDAIGSVNLNLDSSWRDVVRTLLPYNGPVEDDISKRFAGDLDIPDAMEMLALPVTIRNRVVGVIFGLGSHGSIFEEHLTMLSQAIGEAFERILLARK